MSFKYIQTFENSPVHAATTSFVSTVQSWPPCKMLDGQRIRFSVWLQIRKNLPIHLTGDTKPQKIGCFCKIRFTGFCHPSHRNFKFCWHHLSFKKRWPTNKSILHFPSFPKKHKSKKGNKEKMAKKKSQVATVT